MTVAANEGFNSDVRGRLRAVETSAAITDAAITRHEAVCAERYKAIHTTISALGQRLTMITGLVGAGLIGEALGWKAGIVALVKLLFGSP